VGSFVPCYVGSFVPTIPVALKPSVSRELTGSGGKGDIPVLHSRVMEKTKADNVSVKSGSVVSLTSPPALSPAVVYPILAPSPTTASRTASLPAAASPTTVRLT